MADVDLDTGSVPYKKKNSQLAQYNFILGRQNHSALRSRFDSLPSPRPYCPYSGRCSYWGRPGYCLKKMWNDHSSFSQLRLTSWCIFSGLTRQLNFYLDCDKWMLINLVLPWNFQVYSVGFPTLEMCLQGGEVEGKCPQSRDSRAEGQRHRASHMDPHRRWCVGIDDPVCLLCLHCASLLKFLFHVGELY